MWKTWVQSLGWEGPLEEGVATHCSILAWRIPMDRRAWRATTHNIIFNQGTWEAPACGIHWSCLCSPSSCGCWLDIVLQWPWKTQLYSASDIVIPCGAGTVSSRIWYMFYVSVQYVSLIARLHWSRYQWVEMEVASFSVIHQENFSSCPLDLRFCLSRILSYSRRNTSTSRHSGDSRRQHSELLGFTWSLRVPPASHSLGKEESHCMGWSDWLWLSRENCHYCIMEARKSMSGLLEIP